MSLVKRETAWPLDLVLAEDRVDKAFRDMFRASSARAGATGRPTPSR